MTAFPGVQKNLTVNSLDGGAALVTIGSPAVDISPSAQPCQSCIVAQHSGSHAMYMNINTAATTSGWLLSSTIPTTIAIADLSMLHFLGTAGETVQILYRL
jgi:hypothetical protein